MENPTPNDPFLNEKNINESNNNLYQTKPIGSDFDSRESFRYRSVSCPCCHTTISATKKDVGKKFECPDCGTMITVPTLDFDAETEYEYKYFNEEKRLRDKTFSPIRNPNRIGIQITDEVYGVRELSSTNSTSDKSNEIEYIPIHCRVCETLIQVPVFMLGKKVVCPDCGTETLITNGLKEQLESTNVKFQVKETDVYELGPIPEEPQCAFQRPDGKTVILTPGQKNNPGLVFGRNVENSLNKGAESREIKSERSGNSESTDDKSNIKRQEAQEDLKTENERITKRTTAKRFKAWLKKRYEVYYGDDWDSVLPQRILRRRKDNGELAWTYPSPPKKYPLFNKTFQAAFSVEIWSRGIAVALVITLLMQAVCFCWEHGCIRLTDCADKLSALVGWIIVIPCAITAFALLWIYFNSVYLAGNCGAKRVVEWGSEDLLDFPLRGLAFLTLTAFALLPGILVDMHFYEEMDVTKRLCAYGSPFWLLFPIFWISTIQADNCFCLLTRRVISSFFNKCWIWGQFYLATLCVLLIPCILVFGFLPDFIGGFNRQWLQTLTFATWFYAPASALLGIVLYALLLGRLSWILDDEIRNADYEDIEKGGKG